MVYVSIGGSTFAVDNTIVILGAFILLLIFYIILFTALRKLQQIKEKRIAEKGAPTTKPYGKGEPVTPEKTPAEIPVKAEPSREEETLDGRYAREYNLLQCPYCETFNSQDALRCCACGKHIRR